MSSNSLFLTSWYLDAVSPNWGAIVWGDYESAFPVTKVRKFGVNQIIQPIFTREFTVIGASISIPELFLILKPLAKNIDLRFSTEHEEFNPKKRSHQFLSLECDFGKNYSTNAKRLIKKSKSKFEFKHILELDEFFQLIEDTLVPKIAEFNTENIRKLNRLMVQAQRLNKADCIGVYEEGEMVGAGFFFKHQTSITYLKGAATESAKKNGAMFGLINYALHYYQPVFSVFDFGGSTIKNVGDFYRKFGATDRIYYHYELNSLPFWYRWAKKWQN